MNTQSRKPYFRKFNKNDWMAYMGCDENPIIAEYKDFTYNGYTVDIDIVIDTWISLEDKKVERIGFYILPHDFNNVGYVFISEAGTRTEARKIAKHMMSTNLSVEAFKANKFSTWEQ